MPDSFQNLQAHIRETWGQLPRQAKIIIPAIAVAILGGLIGLSVWSGGDEYTELFTGLTTTNLMNVQAYIEEYQGVTSRIDRETNSILVPADLAPGLRLQVLYNDVLAEGDGDLLDVSKGSMLATPEQLRERAQRAAERKLQRSIESLLPVYRASVNLTLAKDGVFLGEDQPAKAAVNLKLRPSKRLSPEQVDAIYKLIVHSVAGLSRENVTMLDADGNLLMGDSSTHTRMDSTISHWEYQQQQAEYFERKIRNVLSPVVGNEQDIRVGVHVESGFDQTEQTTRTYVNDESVLLEEESTDETAQGSLSNGLPPGTASNVATDASINSGSGTPPVAIQRVQNKKSYQPSVEETTTVMATGGIKRVTAAVNINEIKPWTPQEISKFEEIVKTAIGYKQERGDLVTVSSFAFRTATASTPASALDRVLVYLPEIAKYGVIGLLGFMLLLLLRSVMSTLHVGEAVEPEALAGERRIALDMLDDEDELATGTSQQVKDSGETGVLSQGASPEDMFDFDSEMAPSQVEMQNLQKMVGQMAHEDPDVILRVIEGWLSEDRTELDMLDDEE